MPPRLEVVPTFPVYRWGVLWEVKGLDAGWQQGGWWDVYPLSLFSASLPTRAIGDNEQSRGQEPAAAVAL